MIVIEPSFVYKCLSVKMEENNSETVQRISFSIVQYLETKIGVCNIKLEERPAANLEDLSSWEQKYSCLLPNDMKNYYLSTNGMKLTWSVKMDSSTPYALGFMFLHPINDVQEIESKYTIVEDKPVPLDPDSESEDDVSGLKKPSFSPNCRVFELDPCEGLGKVCLVYRDCHLGCSNMRSEIWFLDRSLCWHFLVDTFTTYYRLMLLHLGLPQWQYTFTDIGLSMQAKQWFNMYAPNRIQIDVPMDWPQDPEKILDSMDAQMMTPNQLDVVKVFRGKGDKKKPPLPQQMNQTVKKKTTQIRQTSIINSRLAPMTQNASFKGNR